MAKNRKDEHYPVVRTGRIFRPTPDPIGPNIQLSIERLLSKTNRRIYRQTRNYSVKLDLDANVENASPIDVYALCDSWMNEQALKMAHKMYMENSEDERARLSDSQEARWQDFRTVSGANITIADPVQYDETFTPTVLTAGEFNDTIVVDKAGASRFFTWTEFGNAARYSILEEYNKAGDAQESPNTNTADMPYDDLMADDDAAMAEALQVRGNAPPYDATGVLQASPWVKVGTLSTGTSQRLSTGFFNAPCGFVILNAPGVPGGVTEGAIQWTVKAGDYKGVHAPNMLE